MTDGERDAGTGKLGEAESASLKEEFIRVRGYWNTVWDDLLRLDPAFFRAYLDLSAAPWRAGPLEPKVKELIYIALDASPTHLYEPGLRIHVRNALKLGATAAEILEVLELSTTIGIHACTVGLPILTDEIRRAEQRGRGDQT
jgi:alkylhydroperoxidase/carboxymuconolactone decarboxylase family protein YurZ